MPHLVMIEVVKAWEKVEEVVVEMPKKMILLVMTKLRTVKLILTDLKTESAEEEEDVVEVDAGRNAKASFLTMDL